MKGGGIVCGAGEWILPQHGPHTYMRENRIPDGLQPSAIRFFKNIRMTHLTQLGLTDWELEQAKLDELYSYDKDEPWWQR